VNFGIQLLDKCRFIVFFLYLPFIFEQIYLPLKGKKQVKIIFYKR